MSLGSIILIIGILIGIYKSSRTPAQKNKKKTVYHPAFINTWTIQHEELLKSTPNGTYVLLYPSWARQDHLENYMLVIAFDGRIKVFLYTEYSPGRNLVYDKSYTTCTNQYKKNYSLEFENGLFEGSIFDMLGHEVDSTKTFAVLENIPTTISLAQYIQDEQIDFSI